MQLVRLLVLCVAIFLAVSEDINHFVGQVWHRSGNNDVVFVNVDRDILDNVLHFMSNHPRLIGNGKRSIKCPCNLFFIQNPMIKTEVSNCQIYDTSTNKKAFKFYRLLKYRVSIKKSIS